MKHMNSYVVFVTEKDIIINKTTQTYIVEKTAQDQILNMLF